MFEFFKKVKCKHEWHYTNEGYIYTNNGCDVDAERGSWIFCRKCGKEDLVCNDVWERIKRQQEIIRDYKRD